MRASQISRRLAPLLVLGLVGCGLGGADGGRGSSGFDYRENAIIDRVLSHQVCVNGRRLTFCPADQRSAPTVTPTAATPTVAPGPTATPTAGGTMRIDTQVAAGASVVCTRSSDGAPCELTFTFGGVGFPAGAEFRVASRLRAPDTAWALAAPPTLIPGVDPQFDTVVRLQVPAGATPRVQFAVLIFLAPPVAVPERFESLSQSGTDFAFVTGDFALETITTGPPPTATATEVEPSTPTATPAGPTPTPTNPADGPDITYFGVARADSYSLAPSGYDGSGRPIYVRPYGSGLSLVVEGRPGANRRPVARSAYVAGGTPDLQMIVSRPLGDGSAAVCDRQPPDIGGVPAVSPFAFDDAPAVADAMNDLGCRADDGQGNPIARNASAACTLNRFGEYEFVGFDSTVQYCLQIAAQWAFQPGDTIVAARLRDVGGNLGAVREIVVRNAGGPSASPTSAPTNTTAPPASTATSLPTTAPPTRTPPAVATGTPDRSATPTYTSTPATPGSGPQISHFGITSADNDPETPATSDALGRPVFSVRNGQGLQLVIEARPGSERRPPGPLAYSATGLPDLQLIVSRRLGDGSQTVCDATPPEIGGVPATSPFRFAEDAEVVAAVNDLGCRVDDGTGEPRARASSALACTRALHGENFGYAFVEPTSTVQYCLPIARAWSFAAGDTVVAARVRDVDGRLGPARELVVRVGR